MKMKESLFVLCPGRTRYLLTTDTDVVYEHGKLRTLYRKGLNRETESMHICKLYSVHPDGATYFIGAFENGRYFPNAAWIAIGGTVERFTR